MASAEVMRKRIIRLRQLKSWQLLIVLVVMGFVSATFLRLNNVGMIERREAVLSSDKAGDHQTIVNRLYELQRYVSAHMNADTGPLYLEYQYRRDSQKVVDAAKNAGNQNGNVNVKADAVCKPQYTAWSPAYVQCFVDELAKYPPSPDPAQNVKLPNVQLYRFSYASPLWTPDFAGWSSLVCVVIMGVIVARLIGLAALRFMLKRHRRSI